MCQTEKIFNLPLPVIHLLVLDGCQTSMLPMLTSPLKIKLHALFFLGLLPHGKIWREDLMFRSPYEMMSMTANTKVAVLYRQYMSHVCLYLLPVCLCLQTVSYLLVTMFVLKCDFLECFC